jgi:putative oxidoreductase
VAYEQFAAWCLALAPLALLLLRVFVGLALVPHGLRVAFGWFPNTGARSTSVAQFGASLEKRGARPGMLWASLAVLTELVGGPLLALGLLTHFAAIAVFVFLLTAGLMTASLRKWFYNIEGCEYALMWAIAALAFVALGGGQFSLDRLVGLT